MTYPIEAVPLGSTPAGTLADVCRRLNEVQQEFDFNLPPPRLLDEGVVVSRQNYVAEEVFAWLEEFRARAKGNRPYLIAFVQGPLESATRSNLFGSNDAEKGVAVVTLRDHVKFVSSTHAYVAYYLVRYAIGFVAPDVKAHKETRGCFFDFKENKYHLRESLLEGRFCDPCMGKLQAVFNAELMRAVQSMATLIRNLELQPESVPPAATPALGVAATPVPGGVPDNKNGPFDENRRQFPWGNAILSLIALGVGIGLVVLLRSSSNALGNALLYFAAVLALSLAASLVVFGVLRGYANYKGKVHKGTLELGGSAAMFILVLILGFKLTPAQTIEAGTFNITVHARDDKQRPVTNGRLLMTIGQETKPAVLNNDGEGTFKEIAHTHRGEEVPVEARVPQYTLRDPGRLYQLVPGVITVELQSEPDDPLDALVSADSGKYPADVLVQTLAGSAGGVVVAPELVSRLKRKSVTLQTPLRDVPLKRALEQIFVQLGMQVVFEHTSTITQIKLKGTS